MSLTLEEVKHIANLARLQLSDEELQKYQHQLSDILDYAVMLQKIDTSNIPPTSSMLIDRLELREDTPSTCLKAEELMANAPQFEESQFRVPPVLE